METRKEQIHEDEQPVMGAPERRLFLSEVRAKKSDDGVMEIGGYGALFGSYTRIWWFAEVIEPGFFDGIKDDRAATLFNHDPNQVLGRIKNKTMEWKADEKGAEYLSRLPAHRADVYELIRDGYVYESSFGFTVDEEEWAEVSPSELKGKLPDTDIEQMTYGGKIAIRRLVKGGELFDFSPVTFAAYEGTTTDTRIAQRSFETWKRVSGGDLSLLPYRRMKQDSEPKQQDNQAITARLTGLLALNQ